MKINKTLETAINQHINLQIATSYAFLSMSAWFETTPYKGFAKLFYKRSEKEKRHALQHFDYLKYRLGMIELLAVQVPDTYYESPLAVFEKALELKYIVTESSHKLYSLALRENDFETQEFLHAFFHEQIDEERQMQDNVDKVGLANNNPDAMIHLDYKEEVLYAAEEKK